MSDLGTAVPILCAKREADLRALTENMRGSNSTFLFRLLDHERHENERLTGRVAGLEGENAQLRAEWSAVVRSVEDLGRENMEILARVDTASRALSDLRAALEKVRSYNVDIHAGRINYRPLDHIAVIDAALKDLAGG